MNKCMFIEMKGGKRKMKGTNIIAMLAISLLVLSPFVLAQNETPSNETALEITEVSVQDEAVSEELEIADAGIGPDSVVYGLDRAIERINLALTLNKVRRAEKALLIAEERLAEVKAMIEKNKLDKAEIAEQKYKEITEENEKTIDEIESNGNNETSAKALKDVIGLELKAKSHREKVAFVKNKILERQAGKMSEEQIAHLKKVFDRIISKASEMENKTIEKKNKVKIKHKVLAELTDEELEDFESELKQEEKGKAKEKIKEKLENRKANSDKKNNVAEEDEEDTE